jgi:hypothetical protein
MSLGTRLGFNVLRRSLHQFGDVHALLVLLQVLPELVIVWESSTAYLPSQCIPKVLNRVEIGTLCGPIAEIYVILHHPVLRVFGQWQLALSC